MDETQARMAVNDCYEIGIDTKMSFGNYEVYEM